MSTVSSIMVTSNSSDPPNSATCPSTPKRKRRPYGSSSRKSAGAIHAQPDDLLLVSRRTRALWLERHPALASSLPLRRFVAHVLASPSADEGTGLTAVSEPALRGCGWKRSWPKLRRLVGEAGFEIETTSPAAGRCRCVKAFGCAEDLREAVIRDLAETPVSELVSFATGLPPRTADGRAAAPVPDVAPLLERLNAQPAEAFGQAAKAAESERNRIGRLRSCKTETLAALARYSADPAPRYHAVACSPRLYTSHPVQNLPRGVRADVLKRCHHLDIRSSQLHIAAWLWDCPLLKERLRASVWPYLLASAGIPENDKQLAKDAVYAIVFGAELRNVRRSLAESAGRASADAFLGLPEIRELLDRRDERLAQIHRGPILDAFGRVLDPSAWPKVADADDVARSILAYQMQSYELAVMLAVAEALEDVPIAAWLHDGLYYACDTAAARELARRADAAAAAKGLELLGSPAILEHSLAELRGTARKAA